MRRTDELINAVRGQAMARGDDGDIEEIERPSATILHMPSGKPLARDHYQAFAAPTGDPQLRVIIYARKLYMMPHYSTLNDVFFDRGTTVALMFQHHRIIIEGRNLLPLVLALRVNAVEWLTEFDPAVHAPITDHDASVILSIEIDTTIHNPLPAYPAQQTTP